MQINPDTAAQFLAAINDYLSNGDIEIQAITPAEAGGLWRHEMDTFLFALFEEALKLKPEVQP